MLEYLFLVTSDSEKQEMKEKKLTEFSDRNEKETGRRKTTFCLPL
jgi:hypothetical protein